MTGLVREDLCDSYEALIWAVFDQALAFQEGLRLQRHLESCRRCAVTFTRAGRLEASLNELGRAAQRAALADAADAAEAALLERFADAVAAAQPPPPDRPGLDHAEET